MAKNVLFPWDFNLIFLQFGPKDYAKVSKNTSYVYLLLLFIYSHCTTETDGCNDIFSLNIF